VQVSEDELIAAFDASEQFPGLKGTVVGARVVRDPKLTVGLGFGYVHFASPAAASMALEVNGTKLAGRALRVMPYKASKGGVGGGVGGTKGGYVYVPPSALIGGKGSRSVSGKDRGLGSVRQGGVEKFKLEGGGRRVGGKKGESSEWQGLRTKGKGKVKGSRPGGGGQAGMKGGSGRMGTQARPKGKRPAVAARKAAAKGQGSSSRPSAVAKGKGRGKGRA
jgi:RNA recognition motif-containing protein